MEKEVKERDFFSVNVSIGLEISHYNESGECAMKQLQALQRKYAKVS